VMPAVPPMIWGRLRLCKAAIKVPKSEPSRHQKRATAQGRIRVKARPPTAPRLPHTVECFHIAGSHVSHESVRQSQYRECSKGQEVFTSVRVQLTTVT
jgi:hypothetical protein